MATRRTARTVDDERFMRRALVLAARGGARTRPNPTVGAVVVRGGRIAGEGFHRVLGADHAEVVALRAAGVRARGATLYVTLEPCAHQGRTPPCVEAIVRAGITRCVVATRDPHVIVNGRGLRALRKAGITTEVGLLAREARLQLGGYWLAHTAGRPRVTWKVAATLDGKIADAHGASRWITGSEARHEVHRMRAAADVVLVGAGTARADNPRLTARIPGVLHQPLRVVLDTRLELPLTLKLFSRALSRGTVVVCGPRADARRARLLERRGVTVWRLPATRAGVSPRAVLRRLAREGAQEVLLECGAALGTPWLREGLVDRMALFVAPRLMGAEGVSWMGALGRRRLARALPGELLTQRRFGSDTLLMVEVLH